LRVAARFLRAFATVISVELGCAPHVNDRWPPHGDPAALPAFVATLAVPSVRRLAVVAATPVDEPAPEVARRAA
jgi:hypothetical protein